MGILDGIVEWIAEQVMNILDLITTSVLGALGCSMDTFQYVEDIIEEDTPTLVLFHGSNIAFDKIDFNKSHNRRDFGRGFYCTVLEQQANEWANRLYLRTHTGGKYVYRYIFLSLIHI